MGIFLVYSRPKSLCAYIYPNSFLTSDLEINICTLILSFPHELKCFSPLPPSIVSCKVRLGDLLMITLIIMIGFLRSVS